MTAEFSAVMPATIVQHAIRTGEQVILEDAAVDAGPFAADEYIARRRPRSVLCLPILRQAQPVACLYLENALVAGAFTRDRLTALVLLAAQAAISLDNARLLLAESRALERLASVALAVRDMANTPLQTLTLSIEMLQDRCDGNTLARMSRAVERLKKLDQAMSAYSSQVRWRNEDMGFDALAVIAEAAPKPLKK